jgi:hypothetical protein
MSVHQGISVCHVRVAVPGLAWGAVSQEATVWHPSVEKVSRCPDFTLETGNTLPNYNSNSSHFRLRYRFAYTGTGRSEILD